MRSNAWLWSIVGVICAGTLIAFAACVFQAGSTNSFFWPLPLVLLAPGFASVSGLTLAMKDAHRPRFAIVTAVACVMVASLFVLGMFDVDIPGDSSAVFTHIKNVFVPAAFNFTLWGSFFLTVRAIEGVDRPLRIARLYTLISGTVLALAWFAYTLAEELFSFGEAGWRIGLTLATILVTGGLLSLPFLYRLQQKRRPFAERVAMTISGLLCPRCGAVCATEVGGSCVQCQLPIELDLREPRCACGYLLVNLDGNTCPECGRRFAARIRYEMVSRVI